MRQSIAGLFILGTKFVKVLIPLLGKLMSVLVKLFKGAAGTKFALGAASFGVYAVLLDWRFAVCVLACIGIHESGHVWAMRRSGMATRGFYFIPLFGGAAVPESQFHSARSEVFVALAGPLWGLGTTCVTWLLYALTGSIVFEVAACWMAFVNLINLLPLYPLDGGRVVRAIVYSASGVARHIVRGITLTMLLMCAWWGYWLFVWIGFAGMMEEGGRQRSAGDKDARKTYEGLFAFFAACFSMKSAAPEDISRVLAKTRKDRRYIDAFKELVDIRRGVTKVVEKLYRLKYGRRRSNVRVRDWLIIQADTMLKAWKYGVPWKLDTAWLEGYVGESAWDVWRLGTDVETLETCNSRLLELRDRVERITPMLDACTNELLETCGGTWPSLHMSQYAIYVLEREQAAQKQHIETEQKVLSEQKGSAWRWGLCAVEVEQIPLRVHDTTLYNIVNSWQWSVLPVLVAEESYFAKLMDRYHEARPKKEWGMNARETIWSMLAYITLGLVLIGVMHATGGHEAASGAAKFFKDM